MYCVGDGSMSSRGSRLREEKNHTTLVLISNTPMVELFSGSCVNGHRHWMHTLVILALQEKGHD
jgi:hypothetical protein